MKIEHVRFHPIRSKEPPSFYFPTFGPAKYFLHKTATTAKPSWGEVNMKFSKQELSCFLEKPLNSSRINWTGKLDCVNANIFHGTQKSLNDNWTTIGSC